MSDFTLVIGNKNYSSWSLRAWLAMEQTGAPFTEKQIWFDEDRDRAKRRQYAPTGRVPVLLHGDLRVWDSLAIVEYLAEQFPARGLWPAAPAARARARSVCAEMHSGFVALRREMPMDTRARFAPKAPSPEAAADIARVIEIWASTRAEFGPGGPFLFGQRSIADAYFAPVVSRFVTHAVPLRGAAAAYRDAVLALPALQRWMQAAAAETHGDD